MFITDFRFQISDFDHLSSSSGTPGRATSSKGGLLAGRIPTFRLHAYTFTRSNTSHLRFLISDFEPPLSKLLPTMRAKLIDFLFLFYFFLVFFFNFFNKTSTQNTRG